MNAACISGKVPSEVVLRRYAFSPNHSEHHPYIQKLVKMTFRVVFVLVSILWALIVADNTTSDSTTATTAKPVISVTTMNSSLVVNKTNNSKMPHEKGRGSLGFDVDSSTIQRALYVLIGITVIGVLYFLVRAVR